MSRGLALVVSNAAAVFPKTGWHASPARRLAGGAAGAALDFQDGITGRHRPPWPELDAALPRRARFSPSHDDALAVLGEQVLREVAFVREGFPAGGAVQFAFHQFGCDGGKSGKGIFEVAAFAQDRAQMP